MSVQPVDVLARAIDKANAKASGPTRRVQLEISEAEALRAAVAELIAADKEYDAANRDWEHFTSADPDSFTAEAWAKVADRFEAAVMRRISALARVQGGQS